MRYLGHKTKLADFLRRGFAEVRLSPGGRALDAFTGTAAVGVMLKSAGCSVTCVDLMELGRVFAEAHVVADEPLAFDRLGRVGIANPIAYLTGLPPVVGSISTAYGPEGGRGYFTAENAARIDAVAAQIRAWDADGLLTVVERATLLASLIHAADAVANTAGVYAAFLKTWQSNARRTLNLRDIPRLPANGRSHTAIRGDVAELAGNLGPFDLVYCDPPYNQRQYAGYYHIPELIARGDEIDANALRGRTGLPPNLATSDWSRPGRAPVALQRLLASLDARSVLFSYNDEGILREEEILGALHERFPRGRVGVHRSDYARYRADRDRPGRRIERHRVSELLFFATTRP